MNLFKGIIDIYDENRAIDLSVAWKMGVRAILHETSMGLYKKDSLYSKRKKQALEIGFLWGGYHLLSAESIDEQLDRLLEIEDCSDPRVAIAIDWEKTSRGLASGDQVREFVSKFNQRMQPRYADRYPMIYGGQHIRDDEQIQAGDTLLSKCPLWYVRFNKNGPIGIPTKTWPSYTLWQFDDEHREYGAPSPEILPGADFSCFEGTEDQLRAAWPFIERHR